MPRTNTRARQPLFAKNVPELARTNNKWINCDFRRGSIVTHRDRKTGNDIHGTYFNIRDNN